MCYEMYSDVAYFISIYYYIQICFYSIGKMPRTWYGGKIWRVPETADWPMQQSMKGNRTTTCTVRPPYLIIAYIHQTSLMLDFSFQMGIRRALQSKFLDSICCWLFNLVCDLVNITERPWSKQKHFSSLSSKSELHNECALYTLYPGKKTWLTNPIYICLFRSWYISVF